MDELTRTQMLLADATCPGCGGKGLSLHLRCDLGLDECLYTATCSDCNALFTVARPSAASVPAACGDCEETPKEAYLCDTDTRECRPVPACTSCETAVTPLAA
ncbi:MAG: hypothetical protein ACE5FN_07045 [Leptospirillia bacterium]